MFEPLKILVVDDFEVVRSMLKNALLDMGVSHVDEAGDGRDALAKIESAHAAGKLYDVIFCDWNMPEISGLEVIEACRSKPEFKDLPIIMVTAEAEKENIVKALKAGATDYIVKPIAPPLLETRLKKILKNTKGAA